ncbi:hypothetical protein FALBO_1263 [Fusarium albosuccineum]|uniref:Uncharacterized protein n=1 Tax=Fusarium albosuccineum TaxID=1237068 RepID=A0A8H4LQG4_9HYPO|nr:hypothetical protein FALBO_1263 [Fusarium albosuccineum]
MLSLHSHLEIHVCQRLQKHIPLSSAKSSIKLAKQAVPFHVKNLPLDVFPIIVGQDLSELNQPYRQVAGLSPTAGGVFGANAFYSAQTPPPRSLTGARMTESGLLAAQQPIEVAVRAPKNHSPDREDGFLARHGASLDRFLDVIIPFSCVINQAIVTDSKSKDEVALDTLIAFRAMDLSELHDNINMPDDDAKDLKGVDLQSLGRIPLITKTVRHMRVEVDWDRVFEVMSLAFYRDWQELGRHWQEAMSNPAIVAKPYTRYLTGVRTTYKDLAFDNLGSLTPEERPDRPIPATTIFINAEEQEMHDACVARLVRLKRRAAEPIFIKDVFPKWQAKDSDVETHGIAADGRSLATEERLDYPILQQPSSSMAKDSDIRTASLIARATEEQEIHDTRAVQLERRAIEPQSRQAAPCFWQNGYFPTSPVFPKWQAKDSDIETYSIAANGHSWAAVPLDPAISVISARSSSTPLRPTARCPRLPRRLHRSAASLWAEDHCNEEIRAAGGKNDDSRVKCLLEHLDEKRLQAFMDVAGQID